MSEERPSALFSYTVAVGAVALATGVRYALDPIVGDRVPFAAFYAAITAVAFFGRRGAAFAATAASALIGNVLFVSPRFVLKLGNAADVMSLALFISAGVLVILLTARLSHMRQRLAETARAEARHAAAILEERSRLQAIITSIPGVVWEAWGEPDAANQRIDYVSEYVETMVGYSPAEWTSRPNFWLQLVPPEDREHAARVAAEKFASGEPGENEFRWVTKDGRLIWVIARSSVIKDEQGRHVGMRGVTFDISARKEVERRLALLSEISTSGLAAHNFKELAQTIARRTAEVVGDYCIVRAINGDRLESVAWAHVTPEAEPIVRRLAEQSHVGRFSALYAEMLRQPRTMVENNVSDEVFAQVDLADVDPALFARYRARRGMLVPLISHGRVLGTLGLGRAGGPPFADSDVRIAEAIASRAALALENALLFETAQREAAEARRARHEAEAAGRVKDEFLATLSHELRTPLNAILGWAHMLRDPQLPDDRRQAAVDTIVRNAQSQEQLISDILDVQRIMAGKIRLNLRSVDIGDIVRAAAETVQPSADAKGIRLQLLLDLDVNTIWGDSDRLQQVVWNLLSNAIKFAPKGGRVQVRLSREDGHCVLVVEDNGAGISPEFLPYVFERFRQADSSTTRTHKGLGLGLSIVRSLVEMHGGTIEAGNIADEGRTGAVFTIRLPQQVPRMAVAPGGDGDLMAESASWLGEAPSLDGLSVLVVEDDRDARELVAAILQRCGARVTVAASVAEGLDCLSAERPDVLISDIEMPHEDGLTLIRKVRALERDRGGALPAAALTAYASTGDRVKALGAGFNIHIAKPVQPTELAIVVASLAGRRAS